MNSTSTKLLITNSTSTNFISIAIKIVLVEFVLLEAILVGDPLYYINSVCPISKLNMEVFELKGKQLF